MLPAHTTQCLCIFLVLGQVCMKCRFETERYIKRLLLCSGYSHAVPCWTAVHRELACEVAESSAKVSIVL